MGAGRGDTAARPDRAGAGNATHGLLRNTAYTLVSAGADAVTDSASVYPQHGYPFALDTQVEHRLTDEGLRVTHTIANVGGAPAPFGVGAHPYLRVGDVSVDDLVLTVAAAHRHDGDERKIPRDLVPVDGTGFDLRTGVRLGDLDADTAFTDLSLAASGRFEHRLTGPRRSRGDAVDRTGLRLGAGLHPDELSGSRPRRRPDGRSRSNR